jgi:hypothetical protein
VNAKEQAGFVLMDITLITAQIEGNEVVCSIL